MAELRETPVVIFGKLAGFGLLLVGASAFIAASGYFASIANSSPKKAPVVPSQLSVKHDFQLVQMGDFRRDQFLVDKETGRIWQRVCSGEVAGADCKGLLMWDEMYVDGVTPGDSSATRIYLQQALGRK